MKTFILLMSALLILTAIFTYFFPPKPPLRMKLQRIPADERCVENYCEAAQCRVVETGECFDCWADDFEVLLDRLERVFQAASVK